MMLEEPEAEKTENNMLYKHILIYIQPEPTAESFDKTCTTTDICYRELN